MPPSSKSKRKRSRLFVFLLLFSVALLLALPLLQEKSVKGDDWRYHLSRIQNIADSLTDGHFPAKIHPTSLNGYGYGNGLFYPNLFLYIPAVLRACGMHLSAAYQIFLAMIIVGMVASTYLCANYMLKSRYAALCAAILFPLSQAVITNLYHRAAVGEALAAIFLPIVLCGLYNLLYERFSRPWILILAFTGLLYCHTISLVLSLLAAVAAVAVHAKKLFFSNRGEGLRLFARLAAAAGLTLLLSVSYWLPMLEQFLTGDFNFNHAVVHMENKTIQFRELFALSRPSVGVVLLLLAILCLIFFRRKRRRALLCLGVGLSLSLLATGLFGFLWKELSYTPLAVLQFPWRLLPYAALFLSLGVGQCLHDFSSSRLVRQQTLAVVYLAAALVAVNSLNAVAVNTSDIPANICNLAYSTGAGAEWLPYGTDMNRLNTPLAVAAPDGAVLDVTEKHGTTVRFEIDGTQGYFDVPLLYYAGYTAEIRTPDGTVQKLQTSRSPDNNLTRVTNDGHLAGTVTVAYTGTAVQFAAYAVNLLTVAALIAYGLVRRRRSRPAGNG